MRATNILILSSTLIVVVVLVALVVFRAQGRRGVDAEILEARAERRFVAERGLSPCDPHAREVLILAQGKLRREAVAHDGLIAVVAPTFSPLEIIVQTDSGYSAYQVGSENLFAPPASDWFSGELRKVSEVQLRPPALYNVQATLSRSVRYAMTAREYGLDGVAYYIGWAEDSCAFTSHPREEGPAALVTQLLAEMSDSDPSSERIKTLAAAIDKHDAAR